MTITGIDVSNNNGLIDWKQVAASGVQFTIIKRTEGLTFSDAFASYNWTSAQNNGIARGYYHFARPSLNSAAAEATFFVSRVGPLSVGDVLALDLEDENAQGDLTSWVHAWMAAVKLATGVLPLLYSSPGYMTAHLTLTDAQLATYGLWLADWGLAAEPPPPAPWPFIAAWQHDDNGTVPGISGAVDLDTFYGTLAQFQAYGLPAPAPKPTLPWDDTARWQLVKFIAGGSGPADISTWLQQYDGG